MNLTSAPSRLVFVAMFLLLAPAPAAAQRVVCPPARYFISSLPLVAGPNASTTDEILIRDIGGVLVASIRSGDCPLAEAKLKGKSQFTKLTTRFLGCRDVPGPVTVKARIAAPACNALVGRVKAPKALLRSERVKDFAAVLAPSLQGPSGIAVDTAGGSYTNPNDGSRITVPPGALAGGQGATVSIVALTPTDVAAIETLLGVTLPPGLESVKSWQVILGPADPAPRSSVSASVPDDGDATPGTLVHALLEPTFVDGVMDSRSPRLVYDGGVVQGAGRYEVRLSPQSFGSPPGLSRVVRVPDSMPTCFIDGVVRDSNGSPVPGALVSMSSLPGLEARASAAGFYRAVAVAGANTVTATLGTMTGSRAVLCDPDASARMAGVNVIVGASPSPFVPIVDIVDPGADEVVGSTVRTITGTVSDLSVDRVTIVTQNGEFADAFIQTAPVANGNFTAVVILSPGRDNTVVAIATNPTSARTGSDSVVIGVTGSAGEDVRFTMTWDTNGTDVDLHVRTPGANGVADDIDGDTIYWTNRTVGGGTLDVDDTDGFGPENVVFPLGTAQPGTYAFAAHYWRGAPAATTVTVSVFVAGLLTGSFSTVLTADDPATPLAGRNPDAVFNIGTVSMPAGILGPPAAQEIFIDGPD
jgi:uncharacterized protein YfaP (DUF2135 family)